MLHSVAYLPLPFYYYIPDEDTDEQRRAAVVDGLRKPSLRNCRKQHKVCDLETEEAFECLLTFSSNTIGKSHERRSRRKCLDLMYHFAFGRMLCLYTAIIPFSLNSTVHNVA